jgi:haloalkane dehalogenase
METLELPDGRMRYIDEGEGQPVLLVHGTPTSSYLYRRLIPALANHRRVIAPDHLGFGSSDKRGNADYTPGRC